VSLGGHVDALKVVRQICSGDEEEEKEWNCCYCRPTSFLERLREEYRVVSNEREEDEKLSVKMRNKDDDDDDEEHVNAGETNEDDDIQIARLIDELTAAENALSEAQEMLSKKEIEQTRNEIELELSDSIIGLEDLSIAVEEELSDYLQKWQRKFDLQTDIITRLQEELEELGVQVSQYYKFREEEQRRLREEDGDEDDCDYALRAEIELGEFFFS
jgi:hypothetical protein